MYYTGIGSRETPHEIILRMQTIAAVLASKGFTLRSGGANGADAAFEYGCDLVRGKKQIFLPWKEFNGNNSNIHTVDENALKLAAGLHPNWAACSEGARRMHARNCYQVLGFNVLSVDDISKLVICWTRNGSGSGGTGQALRLARKLGVPIYDLGKPQVLDSISEIIGAL